MTHSVKVAGVWKEAANVAVNVGGTWRQVANVSVKVAGVWKQVWQNLDATLPAIITVFDTAISTLNASTAFHLRANGQVQEWQGGSISSTYTWIGGGTGTDYECRLTRTSGSSFTGGDTTNTWLSLSSDRNWILNESRDGNFSSLTNGFIEIRQAAAPQTVYANGAIQFEAVVEV